MNPRTINTPLGPAFMWGPMDYHGAFRPEGTTMPTPANPTTVTATMSLLHDGDMWTWEVQSSVPRVRDDGTHGRVIRRAMGAHHTKETARREAMDALSVMVNPDTTVIIDGNG
jgi:hypothetical protein